MTGAGAWDLPPLRAGYAADEALVERRARAAGPADAAERAGEAMIGGVRCLVIEPRGGAQGEMIYLHGGGYRLGSPLAYLDYAQRIADEAGRRIILPFYPLAPEHPFPAAAHAVVAVYRGLENRQSVVVAGDSAGGGLAWIRSHPRVSRKRSPHCLSRQRHSPSYFAHLWHFSRGWGGIIYDGSACH